MSYQNGTTAEPIHVAYLGPEASFSHQAALAVFPPNTTPQAILHPLPSFGAIFNALQDTSKGNIEYTYALLPVENSTNGSVVQVLDLFSQCSDAKYPDLEVCAEHYLEVHHCLFTYASPSDTLSDAQQPITNGYSLPSSTSTSANTHNNNNDNTNTNTINPYSKLKTIYTHPQVWGQCNRFLSQHFPSPTTVERIDVSSTSAAAKLVAQDTSGTSAAISSILAGEKNGLRLLARNIEDEPGENTTRFFVVRNKTRRRGHVIESCSAGDGDGDVVDDNDDGEIWNHKSLITFTIPHRQPGSLADALAVFKARGFNLTSIQTRPSRRRNWHYVFLVECEEKRRTRRMGADGEEGEGNLRQVLKGLEPSTETLRYLGSWVDQLQGDAEAE